MLTVRNLAVDHGKLRAIWDLNLFVNAGERVGLLGTNGAGKSTTLGAIIGAFRPTHGAIQFRGEEISRRSVPKNVAAGIALVPEGRRLFPEMTVFENLNLGAYPREARGSASAEIERVYSLFPILSEKRGQQAGSLSGGQQQMVAIGRALMSKPTLLLLDEPFIGVAPIVIGQVMSALEKVSEAGVTIVMVEQNIHRALKFVSRAYVIENGRVVLEGTRDQLEQDSQFADKFLGLHQ